MRSRLFEKLIPRQREVLACLVRGFSNREIAQRLGISVRTVEGHLRLIYKRLGVRTRAAATYVVMSTVLLDRLPVVEGNK